jgi:tetratricopeptide (TPR) repeat protein
LAVSSKFKCSLSKEEEQDDAIYLPQKIEIGVLFKRLEALLGVQLTDEARSELENFSESFEFVHSDIKEIYPKVKHMNIVDYAEGMALYLAAIRRKEAGERERLRQLRLSSAKFARAISTLPDSYLTLYQWGLVIAEEAKMTSTLNAQKLFQEAIEKLKSALDINEAFQGCWIKLGEIQLEVAKLAPSTSNSTRSGSSIEKKKSMPTIQSAKSLYLAAASSFNRALTIDDYFIEEVYKKMQGLHTAATSQRSSHLLFTHSYTSC